MPIHEIVVLITLFLWLMVETIWALRTKDRKIPVWFSLVKFLPGLIWLGYFVSPWSALLMAISIASTEIYPHSLVLGFVGLFAPPPVVICISPQLMPLVIGWGVLVTLWMLRILGGADALAACSSFPPGPWLWQSWPASCAGA